MTFPRLADHEIAYAVVELDDGPVYLLRGGPAGTALPHDIRHLIVERELGIVDGIWGSIAAGAAPARVPCWCTPCRPRYLPISRR